MAVSRGSDMDTTWVKQEHKEAYCTMCCNVWLLYEMDALVVNVIFKPTALSLPVDSIKCRILSHMYTGWNQRGTEPVFLYLDRTGDYVSGAQLLDVWIYTSGCT